MILVLMFRGVHATGPATSVIPRFFETIELANDFCKKHSTTDICPNWTKAVVAQDNAAYSFEFHDFKEVK